MTENIKSEPMTPEQIKNWRRALCISLGPYALIMPESEIIAIRNKMQNDLHTLATEHIEKAKAEEPKAEEINEGAARYWRKKLAQRSA